MPAATPQAWQFKSISRYCQNVPQGAKSPPIENYCSGVLGPPHPGLLQPQVKPYLRGITSFSFCPLWHAIASVAYACEMFLVPAGNWTHVYLAQAEPAKILRTQKESSWGPNIKLPIFFLYLSPQKADATRTGRWLGFPRWNLHFENGNYPAAFVWTGRATFSEREVSEAFWLGMVPGLG